ncbi:MAG: hypothetical protein CL521_02310 [Actinobacteria bacterium]|nr:hypothetical protein [Actinomycetota bacterium]|tara:strand:+ start:39 stop:389 length:351 start_codon:yes stop_codon:yes gene_type:complete
MNKNEFQLQVGNQVLLFIKGVLQLDQTRLESISWSEDIKSQVGLDSLRAFDMIVYIHESLGVDLPENMGLEFEMTINGIASYIINQYDLELVEAFLAKTEDEVLALMSDEDDFDDL